MRVLLMLFLITSVLTGCGGGGGNRAGGQGGLTLTVRWPSTRDIPPATRSIKVQAQTLFKNDEGVLVTDKNVGQRVVSRPEWQSTSTVSLDDLPSVKVRVKVTAYVSVDGTGDPIAFGTKDVDIASGETTSVTITLHGDITSIDATPESLTLESGETKSLAAQGKDSNGSPVIIEDARWVFTSIDPSLATVVKRPSPNGHIADVTGVSQGNTAIRIEDSLTGLSTDVSVSVGAPSQCSSYFARMRSLSDTGFEGASVSGAFAFWNSVFATIFSAGTGEARAKAFVKVSAPLQSGSFTIKYRSRLRLTDERPGPVPHSGRVTLVHPMGTDNLSSFVETPKETSHTLTVRDGQVLRFDWTLTVSSSDDTGVTANGDLFIDESPSGVSLDDITCGEDPDTARRFLNEASDCCTH